MATKNDVTGDSLISRPVVKLYEDGWERIFGNRSDSNQPQVDNYTAGKDDSKDLPNQ